MMHKVISTTLSGLNAIDSLAEAHPKITAVLRLILQKAFEWTACLALAAIAPNAVFVVISIATLGLGLHAVLDFFINKVRLDLIEDFLPSTVAEQNKYETCETIERMRSCEMRKIKLYSTIFTVSLALAPVFPLLQIAPLIIFTTFSTGLSLFSFPFPKDNQYSLFQQDQKITKTIASEFRFLTRMARAAAHIISDQWSYGAITKDAITEYDTSFFTNNSFLALALLKRFERRDFVPKKLLCFQDSLPKLRNEWDTFSLQEKKVIDQAFQPNAIDTLTTLQITSHWTDLRKQAPTISLNLSTLLRIDADWKKLSAEEREALRQLKSKWDSFSTNQKSQIRVHLFVQHLQSVVQSTQSTLRFGLYPGWIQSISNQAIKSIEFREKISFLPKPIQRTVEKVVEIASPFL